jgi:hypothetical protein
LRCVDYYQKSLLAGAYVRKILFVEFAEQGTTILGYPAIGRAIEMVGREHVYFIVFDDNRFILDAPTIR